MDHHRQRLRELAVRDHTLVTDLLANDTSNTRACASDAKTHALTRITATITVDAP